MEDDVPGAAPATVTSPSSRSSGPSFRRSVVTTGGAPLRVGDGFRREEERPAR